jgi:hypothetical protein
MSKSASSVLTANRLRDGTVVFLDHDGVWVESFAGAAIARSPDEARALEARGVHDAARNLVVEPYLIELRDVAGRLEPVRYRERVRIAGPSIIDDVPGYQSPSPHASPTSPPTPPAWGEDRGEGQHKAPTQYPAPHPNPLPVKNGEREHGVQLTEAA